MLTEQRCHGHTAGGRAGRCSRIWAGAVPGQSGAGQGRAAPAPSPCLTPPLPSLCPAPRPLLPLSPAVPGNSTLHLIRCFSTPLYPFSSQRRRHKGQGSGGTRGKRLSLHASPSLRGHRCRSDPAGPGHGSIAPGRGNRRHLREGAENNP